MATTLRSKSMQRSKSSVHFATDNNANGDALSLSNIHKVVAALDADIDKLSTYLQQHACVTDHHDVLNQIETHLTKLIARKKEYVKWWQSEIDLQKKKEKMIESKRIKHQQQQQQQQALIVQKSNNNFRRMNYRNNNLRSRSIPTASNKLQGQQQINASSTELFQVNSAGVVLKNIKNLRQLEHYKNYYNQQLAAMIKKATNDISFIRHVDYYKLKLKALQERETELRLIKKENDDNKQKNNQKNTQKNNIINSQTQINNHINVNMIDPAMVQKMINAPPYTPANKKTPEPPPPSPTRTARTRIQECQQRVVSMQSDNNNIIKNENNKNHNKSQDAFDLMINLETLGYKTVPQSISQQYCPVNNDNNDSNNNKNIIDINDEEIVYPAMYGPLSQNELKIYIRQTALQSINPAPDSRDNKLYSEWYQSLRKIENIVYMEYMAKHRKKLEDELRAKQELDNNKENENKNKNNNNDDDENKYKLKFKEWLFNEVKLKQYLINFKEKDCDDVRMIQDLDEITLQEYFKIDNRLHCKLIIQKANEFKQTQQGLIWMKR